MPNEQEVQVKYSPIQVAKIAELVQVGSDIINLISDPKKIKGFLQGADELQTLVSKADEVAQTKIDAEKISAKNADDRKQIDEDQAKIPNFKTWEQDLKDRETVIKDAENELLDKKQDIDDALDTTSKTQTKLDKAITVAEDREAEAASAKRDAEGVKKKYQNLIDKLSNV